MLLIWMDLVSLSLYVVTIWFVQRNLRNIFIYRQGEIRKMKNIAIRTLVVALAVVGFSASAISSASTTQATKASKVVAPTVVIASVPNPICGGVNYCGMD